MLLKCNKDSVDETPLYVHVESNAIGVNTTGKEQQKSRWSFSIVNVAHSTKKLREELCTRVAKYIKLYSRCSRYEIFFISRQFIDLLYIVIVLILV